MQNARTARKAKEIQGNADHIEWKDFFSAIYCPPPKTGSVSPLTLAAGSVRSLLDNPGDTRQERKTALIAREQARYKVDIVALRETRFSEQGQLEEVGAGYTFFWSAPVEKPGKLGRHRPGQTNVEESATIFGASHITAAAKSKRETHKSQLSHSSAPPPPPPPPPPPQNENAKSSPTCPQFQRAFWTPIGLFGHLRSDGGTLTAATLVSPSHDIN
ncbi:hypothetical protein SprV_1002888800 [Sparganum proliferum]